MAAMPKPVDGERIECRTDGCTQVVFIVGTSGTVYPKGDMPHLERDGRLSVTCPVCRTRNRYQPLREAA